VTKSNMAARAGLVEYRVTFASLGAVCTVLVDLLVVAGNWTDDPCKRNYFRLLQGSDLNSWSGDNDRRDRNGTLKDLWVGRDLCWLLGRSWTDYLFIFIYFLFKQYLDRGAQFSEAGLNGALFNINLLTNNILQNTEFSDYFTK